MEHYTPDWSEVFSREDYLHFYDSAINAQVTAGQVDFLQEKLALPRGACLLDIACGHGRHANALAALGYRVVGVDISQEFLDLAREDARRHGLEVTYRQEDMRELDFTEEFVAAICVHTSFGYFGDAENALILTAAARALEPGGRFFLDTLNRDGLMANFRPFSVVELGEDLKTDRVTFDPITGFLHNHRVTVRQGRVRKVDFALRIYQPTELKRMLEAAGFTRVDFWGSWQGTPLDRASPRMLVLATKENCRE